MKVPLIVLESERRCIALLQIAIPNRPPSQGLATNAIK